VKNKMLNEAEVQCLTMRIWCVLAGIMHATDLITSQEIELTVPNQDLQLKIQIPRQGWN